MPVTISVNTIVLIAGVIGALGIIGKTIAKVVNKLNYDSEQDERIARLEKQHLERITALQKHHDEDMASTRQEMAIICRGILASLKGDEDSKKSSIQEMDDYLNQRAHRTKTWQKGNV